MPASSSSSPPPHSNTAQSTQPRSDLQNKLRKLGLRRDIDLVLHLPLRYEDETHLTPIGVTRSEAYAQIEGVVIHQEILARPRRQLIVQIQDSSGVMVLRMFNFYANQVKQLAPGVRVRARGEVREGFFGREIIHAQYSIVQEGAALPDRLTPIYPTSAGLAQSALRKLITKAMQRLSLEDTLPEALRARYQLIDFSSAVHLLHAPPPEISASALSGRSHPAWTRIKFDELLAQQLSLKRAHRARREQSAPALSKTGEYCTRLLARLPFQLTAAQQRVWQEISNDLNARHPMQRLLQGDVGSGKTIIATLAALQAIDNGYQAALMAPTEILAEQHFRKLVQWIEELGIKVVWLAGRLKKKDKQNAQVLIENGQAQLVIGTHAIIQADVSFQALGLVIIDEQQRFGVDQRLALRAKVHSGQPHQLMMSATPIPRTLAMTYFADLDVSTIDQLPPGRQAITTKLVDNRRRQEIIQRIGTAVKSGQQAYWVCPLIEENPANEATSKATKQRQNEQLALQTAVATHAELAQALPQINIGLVHGRLSASEKSAVMQAFVQGEIQVLVATTVIEVGVDVANASLMIIEHAERFGLSQLHQLRGRIGRNNQPDQAPASCILLYQQPLSLSAKQRLRILRESQDGFEIARCDLQLRGPGEFLGQRQSGMELLRFADLQTDQAIAEQARAAADWLLRQHPQTVTQHLDRWLNGHEEFLKV